MIERSRHSLFPSIAGIGLISGLGEGITAHRDAMKQGVTRFKPLSELWDEEKSWSPCHASWIENRAQLCSRRHGPAAQLSILLAKQALQDAGWNEEQWRHAAIIVGSSRGNASGWLDAWPGRRPVKLLSVPHSLHSELASAVSIELGITGPYHVLASGCAAGLDAVGMALMLIRSGMVKHALAIGLDLPLTPSTLDTYAASGMLSSTGMNDPYSHRADGMLISEGGAALAITAEESDNDLALMDYRCNSDALHPLAMRPDGSQMATLLKEAVQYQSIYAPDASLCLCPHASGTSSNSSSEVSSWNQVFSSDALPDIRLMKPWVGHTIGGSGILELAMMAMFMRRGSLPPNLTGLTAPQGYSLQTEETDASDYVLIKSAASMGGHNAVITVAPRHLL